MHPLNWALIAFWLLSNSAGVFTTVDQDAICTMDDKTHKAYYHCPEDYDVVYSGEGEKECNGKCYKRGNSDSLKSAIAQLLEDRGARTGTTFEITDEQLQRAVRQLINEEEVSLWSRNLINNQRITLRAPKKITRPSPKAGDILPKPEPTINLPIPKENDGRPVPRASPTPPVPKILPAKEEQ